MKRIFCFLLLSIVTVLCIAPIVSFAEEAVVPAVSDATITTPTEPFSWEYLATIAGAATFTLLVAQFLKFPLDKIWKIPTRVVVYCIAFIVMLIGTAFTADGLTAQSVLLALANAFIAALTAMGGYELTFAKLTK